MLGAYFGKANQQGGKARPSRDLEERTDSLIADERVVITSFPMQQNPLTHTACPCVNLSRSFILVLLVR